jgi:hypothetical protein
MDIVHTDRLAAALADRYTIEHEVAKATSG